MVGKYVESEYRLPELALLASLMLLLFTSCNITDSDQPRDSYSYALHKQAAIAVDTTQRPAGEDSTTTVTSFSIAPGNNKVFAYKHNVNPPEGLADAGLTETLVFQIPSQIDSFEWSGQNLQEHSVWYKRSCFCPLSGAAFEVTKGSIRGDKLSAVHWIVRANITVESPAGRFKIAFDEPFYVEL
ncbi:MAG TPA: hypothetical protein VK074_01095 [Fodinibius sp.]|nr:hypothetical protein [Fodinibius sp.]